MALIDCPECGKQVSDRAPTCPHCGVPILAPESAEVGSLKATQPRPEPGARQASPEAERFDVRLVAPGEQKMEVVKRLRRLTSFGLAEARRFVDSAPGRVVVGVSHSAAQEVRDALTDAGAEAELIESSREIPRTHGFYRSQVTEVVKVSFLKKLPTRAHLRFLPDGRVLRMMSTESLDQVGRHLTPENVGEDLSRLFRSAASDVMLGSYEVSNLSVRLRFQVTHRRDSWTLRMDGEFSDGGERLTLTVTTTRAEHGETYEQYEFHGIGGLPEDAHAV